MSDSKEHRKARPTPADIAAAKRLRLLWDRAKRDRGVKQAMVQEITGWSQGNVSQYLNGDIPLNYRAVLVFAKVIGCEAADIRRDLHEQMHEVQRNNGEDWDDVLASAQAVGLGNGVEADEYAEVHKLKFKPGSLQKKRLNPRNLKVFYGKGDSMLPRIRETDAILFDESDTRVIHEKLYVIKWRGEFNVKRSNCVDDDIVLFEALNPQGDHDWRKAKPMKHKKDPIEVIGRVRWIGSWED